MSVAEHLKTPRCAKLVLPVGAGRTIGANCFVTLINEDTVEAELIRTDISADSLDFDREYRISYLDGSDVVTLSGRIKSFLNEERLHLSIGRTEVRQHKRNGLRVNTRVDLEYRAIDDSEINAACCPASPVNLSRGGICFVSDQQPPINSKLSLLVCLPGENAMIFANGAVRRVTHFGPDHWLVALQFEGISPEEQALIEQFCLGEEGKMESKISYEQFLYQELSIS